jgi:hypothetical protein
LPPFLFAVGILQVIAIFVKYYLQLFVLFSCKCAILILQMVEEYMPKLTEGKKDSVVTIRLTTDLHNAVKETATEDYRNVTDQLNYLINLGLTMRSIQFTGAQKAVNEWRNILAKDKPNQGVI